MAEGLDEILDGATWATQILPQGTPGLPGVPCPSTTCYAVGAVNHTVEATTDGGATWTSQPLPATQQGSAHRRVMPVHQHLLRRGQRVHGNYGGLALATSDGGSRWVHKALPGNTFGALEAVACPSVSTSYVAGVGGGSGLVAVTSNGGATWTVTNEFGHIHVRSSRSQCHSQPDPTHAAIALSRRAERPFLCAMGLTLGAHPQSAERRLHARGPGAWLITEGDVQLGQLCGRSLTRRVSADDLQAVAGAPDRQVLFSVPPIIARGVPQAGTRTGCLGPYRCAGCQGSR